MSRKKILILDDDAWQAESFAQILCAEFSVRIVNDVEECLGALELWQPDILLADVILGAKNVITLLNEMQSYVDTRSLPVVILSAIAKKINFDDVRSLGVRALLDKTSVTPETLRTCLHNIRLEPIVTSNE